MLSDYQILLEHEPTQCCEKRKPYHFLTERHLQAMWFEQKYYKNLHTSEGKLVEVISPGIWNAEAGPDFRKAHIRIEGIDQQGDVEIHFADANWYQHHHHLDERYDQVVLHLSLWKSAKNKAITTKNGQHVTQAYFEDALTVPQARLPQLIDLDLYPYKKFLGSGRCAQTLFRSIPIQKIKTFFKAAALWRLDKKRLHLEAKLADQTCELSLGIAMALGYKHNSEAFLDTFCWLRQMKHLSHETLFSLCLGACGFFEESHQKRWLHSEYYQSLLSIYSKLQEINSKKFKLILNQVRPINHPVRRLFFLTKLACDDQIIANQIKMISLWRLHWHTLHKRKNEFENELKELLPNYQDPYWNHHYTFEKEPKPKFLTLLGDDLKKEILVNAFLPLLQDEIFQRNDPHEISCFQEFYSSLPAANTSKTKYLTHRFFGDQKTIFTDAFTEQGAYQLHRDFCLHYEASCEGCPFVERFKTHFL